MLRCPWILIALAVGAVSASCSRPSQAVVAQTSGSQERSEITRPQDSSISPTHTTLTTLDDASTAPATDARAPHTANDRVASIVYAPRIGPGSGAPYEGNLTTTIACSSDADCVVAAPPTCSPCGSCAAVVSASVMRAPPPRCPSSSRTTAGPSEQPNCAPCPTPPSYAACVAGRCAGGIAPAAPRRACVADGDCVAFWSGGCCGLPTAVDAASRDGVARFTEACAHMPCSAEAANRATSGVLPRRSTPPDARELARYRAACQGGSCRIITAE